MLKPIHTTWMHYPGQIIISVGFLILADVIAFLKIRQDKGAMDCNERKRIFAKILLFNYFYGLLFLAVLGRRTLEYYQINLQAGYSYYAAFAEGNLPVLKVILANIIVFIPMGALGTVAGKKTSVTRGLLCGLLGTLTIEVLQLVLRRGLCEIDDVISNMLGAIIGCALTMICIKLFYLRKGVDHDGQENRKVF